MKWGTHKRMIIFSGIMWLAVGGMLLAKGLGLMTNIVKQSRETSVAAAEYPLVDYFSALFGDLEQGVLGLIVAALFIGYLKGRMVFPKAVKRVVSRIFSLPEPVRITQIYSWKYLLLIGFMISLGFTIRAAGVSADIRGGIDTAIGAALLQGSMFYFRAMGLRKT